MKVLYICKYKSGFKENLAPFIHEMIISLQNKGVDVDILKMKGKGFRSYIRYIFTINKKLTVEKFDIVHAVYGLSAFVACFQSKVPVVTTFIGSDINIKWIRFFCKNFILKKINASIFVSKKLFELAGRPSNSTIIPFGVNYNKFFLKDKLICRQELKMEQNKKYIIFSSRFDRPEKNAELAFATLKLINDNNIELVELKNIPEDQLNTLYNACDIALMTSLSEGSPQFIKEAMACNCPIVSVPVGDVSEVIGNTEGCYLTTYEPSNVAEKLLLALDFGKRTNGRQRVRELELDSERVNEKIIKIYSSINS